MEITVTIPNVKAYISLAEQRNITERFIRRAFNLGEDEYIDANGDLYSKVWKGGDFVTKSDRYLRKATENDRMCFEVMKKINEYVIRRNHLDDL